jgi:hypothetical protein
VSKEKVECSTFSDEGTVKNVAGVGKSVDELRFDDCKIVTGVLKGCGVNSLGTSTEDINGIVTDEVNAAGNGVKITVKAGFELEVPGTVAGCPETVLGAVSGSAEGLQAAKSDKLVFTKAKGLKFLGEESNITGSDETTTETGAKAVVIGPPAINWLVNGTFLAVNKVVLARTSSKAIQLQFKGGVTIVCKKLSDKEKLIGVGKDEITSFTASECKKTLPLPVENATVTAVNLNWSSMLGKDPVTGKEIDTFFPQLHYAVGAKEGTVEGAVVGEWSNATAELAFPETPLEGSTLKTTEGEAVIFSGSDKFELEETGTLEVGEE